MFLEYCQIGNEGAKHLVKSKWPNVYHINLGKLIK